MDFNDYQTGTNATNLYSDAIGQLLAPIYKAAYDDNDALKALENVEDILNVCYPLLGYVGEVAELANKFKKVLRGDRSLGEFVDLSFDEQGDCLYYAAQLAEQTGNELEDIAKANNRKLTDRMNRGVIKGDGDHR